MVYYTMYIKTCINLFNKGQLINFDKENSVLQISIKYKYVHNSYVQTYCFTEENRYKKIVEFIKNDGYSINLLKAEEITEEICKLAVRQNGLSLKYVKEQTEEICKSVVQQNGISLDYVKIEQTEEICKLAVQQNGYALQYVRNQNEEICKLAIQQNSWSFKYVRNQTEEMFKLAVQQN